MAQGKVDTTFLFTDIEGSTRLWETHPVAMANALQVHDSLMRTTIAEYGGAVFKTLGDAFCAVFDTSANAIAAALRAQSRIAQTEWHPPVQIRVRMAICAGPAESRDRDYFGPTLNRTARLLSIGHGGQVLVSDSAYRNSLEEALAGARFLDMGRHRLRDLLEPEHVWQAAPSEADEAFPPLKSLDYLPTNLPPQTTSFVGRINEMAATRGKLQSSRLVTLAGSGGCGKTRLALQIGADLLDEFADGVWLIELAPLSEPDRVPDAAATALKIRLAPGAPPLPAVIDYLRDREALLLLDNCEHLLPAAAKLADEIIRDCPRVKLLVSSREPLGVQGEVVHRVASLAVPEPRRRHSLHDLSAIEAVQLFVDRAQAASPQFELNDANCATVAAIVRSLDGIPTAIELAAARVRAMSVEELHRRLSDHLRILTGGARNMLPHQQTVRALIDWSYRLLNPFESALFRRLSIFRDGWTLRDAEAVCLSGAESEAPIEEWEILDLLTSLVDKSLVVYEEQPSPRYRFTESNRQFAASKLHDAPEEEQTARRRHIERFVQFAELARLEMDGPDPGPVLDRLEPERQNLMHAIRYSIEAGTAECLRLCTALRKFWSYRGPISEGQSWCSRALDATAELPSDSIRAETVNVAGVLAKTVGDLSAARRHFQANLTFYQQQNDLRQTARTLTNLANVETLAGEYDSAQRRYLESLEICLQLEDQVAIAHARGNLGYFAYCTLDFEAARPNMEDALRRFRAMGDSFNIMTSLCNLALLQIATGELAGAEQHCTEAIKIARQLGGTATVSSILPYQAGLLRQRGETEAARDLLSECRKLIMDQMGVLRTAADHGAPEAALHESAESLVPLLEEAARWFGEAGAGVRSAYFWGAADAITAQLEFGAAKPEQLRRDADRDRTRKSMDDATYQTAFKTGAALSGEAILIALAEAGI